MFKKILKISGFVLLGFVLLIGGVVAFMAIRGDFKKQVIKPTAINFSISDVDLVYDVGVTEDEVHSFTITTEPVEVTETECTLKLSSPLITFVKWQNGEWVKNNSSTFHLNRPIYFIINNVVDDASNDNYEIAEDDYYDGVLTITVKDKSGLLQDTLKLEIDRNITSISFKDVWNDDNNKITNGLFAYETGKGENEVVEQKLEAIVNQDYPLEVITAPLKASKPFSGQYPEGDARNFAKKYEIYFVEDNQPKRLRAEGEVVKLQSYNNLGALIEEDCDFLRYDTTNNRYVFNSSQSDAYEFKLATYPTYAVQEELENDNTLSFIERLKSDKMVTKTVAITVSGSEAQGIQFAGDALNITMKLFKESEWVVNDGSVVGPYNLGLTLLKGNTQILERYNELKFLDENSFTNNITWSFRQAKQKADGELEKDGKGEVVYDDRDVVINFSVSTSVQNEEIPLKARVAGIKAGIKDEEDKDISEDVEWNVIINDRTLMLVYEDEVKKLETTISIGIVVDENDDENKFVGVTIQPSMWLENNTLAEVTITQVKTDAATQESSQKLYLSSKLINCFVYDFEDGSSYKTLQAGIYFAILAREPGADIGDKKVLINDKFVTGIEHNGASTIVKITPIYNDLGNDKDITSYTDIELYAIVVNSNGSYEYTTTPRGITPDMDFAKIGINGGQEDLKIPALLTGDEVSFGAGFDVRDLVYTQSTGSYNEILMFVPKYSALDMENAPAEWGKGLVVYEKDGGNYTAKVSEGPYVKGEYYVKNNFETIDIVSIKDGYNEYFLLGYMDNDRFVNKVVTNGMNYYSKLYPVAIKTKYLKDENRLQTAEEYINELLSAKYNARYTPCKINGEVGEIKYDLSLLERRYIYGQTNGYIGAVGNYNSSKIYYIDDNGLMVGQTPSAEDISDWENKKVNYYEAVTMVNINNVVNNVAEIEGLKKYIATAGGEIYQEDVNATEGYYVVVSHYIIESVSNDGANITIKASAVSSGIKLDKEQTFVISVENYNLDKNNVFKVYFDTIDKAKTIKVQNYYDFKNSTTKPHVEFKGEYSDNKDNYFEENAAIDGTNYRIIAGHKDIAVNWEGGTESPIKDKVVAINLLIDSKDNLDILTQLITKLTVLAVEYDEDNQYVGIVSSDKITIKNGEKSIQYIQATDEYNPNVTYYKDGVVAEIDQDKIDNWATHYQDYCLPVIQVEFEVNETIAKGNYIRFEWSYDYSDDSDPYKMYSTRLNILSRDVTKYELAVDKDLYVATVLNEEEYNNCEEVYTVTGSQYDKIADKPAWAENTYYSLTKYNGAGYGFEVQIGYESGKYTYQAYLVDRGAGRYLCIKDGDSYIRKNDTFENAIKWIKPNPIYAENGEFSLQDNDYISFDQDGQDEVKIAKARITDGFKNVTLASKYYVNAEKLQIAIKVIANGFEYVDNSVSGLEGGTYTLNSNTYTHNGTSINNMMDVSVKSFSLNGTSSGYTVTYVDADTITISSIGGGNSVIDIVKDGASWKVTRYNYGRIDLTLTLETVLGEKEYKIEFASPYRTPTLSSTNKTDTLYSGTKFVLMMAKDIEGDKTDYLYRLDAVGLDKYKVEYSVDEIKKGEIMADNGKFVFSVPGATKPTKYDFVVKFKYNDADAWDKKGATEDIYDFSLMVKPNILIVENISQVEEMDDYQNNKYDFKKLTLKKYKKEDEDDEDIEYTSYTTDYDDGAFEDFDEILTYNYETFTDAQFTNKYSTNVATINSGILTVNNPISEAGTYYVKAYMLSGDVLVAEIKFEISTKSNIADADNEEVEAITITANDEKGYSLATLQEMFKLQRNGDIYYEIERWEPATEWIDGKTYKKEGKIYRLLETDPGNLTDLYQNKAYVAGKTYKFEDGKYVLMDTDEGNNYYFKGNLTDILWLFTNNTNLEITYEYDGAILKQTMESGADDKLIYKLDYDGNIYTMIGTSYNVGYKYVEYAGEFVVDNTYYYYDNGTLKSFVATIDKVRQNDVTYYTRLNCEFDTSKHDDFKFVNEGVNGAMTITTSHVGNIYYTSDNGTSIYCAQNAYLFKNVSNENEILAIAIENAGKKIYKFTINANNVQNNSSTEVGQLSELMLKYNSYGQQLDENINYVDNIEYGIELVFDIDGVKTNIKTNNMYNINVQPFKVSSTTNVVLAGQEYVLYDTGDGANTNKGLFNIEASEYAGHIKSISFNGDNRVGTSNYSDGATQTKHVVKFDAVGNNYETYLPITITYNDNRTFTYNYKMLVVNDTVVEIEYPYNVDDVNDSNYNTFNASISEFTTSVDGSAYDLTDLGMWLGNDTTVQGWESDVRVKYDLALKGDIINLKSHDDIRNITRYGAYKYENAPAEFVANTYYTYNKTMHKFEGREYAEEPADWNTLIYFTREEYSTTNIKIEPVAVSSTYAHTLQNVVDSLALNGGIINISTDLEYTGYVVFKVYSGATNDSAHAYGYYILKIVDDPQFNNVVSAQLRREQTISKKLNENTQIIEFIKDGGYEISTVARIDGTLIENDYSNIYLFVVENDLEDTTEGKIIEHEYLIEPQNDTKTLRVAVVLQSGASLVHLCNYKIVVKPDVEVSPDMYNEQSNPNGIIESAEDENYHIYKAKPIEYIYGGANEYDLNTFFEVTGAQGGSLTSVEVDTSKEYSEDCLTFDELNINFKWTHPTEGEKSTNIATIDVYNKKLILKSPISEQVFFYLKLTYESGFNIYLRITIEPFKFETTNQFTVGEWVTGDFNNELNLKEEVFDNYGGLYDIEYDTTKTTIGNDPSNKKLTFAPQDSDYRVNVKITLKDVVSPISKDIIVTVKSNINGAYNANHNGTTPTENRVKADKVEVEEGDTLTAVGSKLEVVKSANNKVEIKNSTDTYLTINAGTITWVKFDLTTDGGQNKPYFINGTSSTSEMILSESKTLEFAHSADDVDLRLNVTVCNYSGDYYKAKHYEEVTDTNTYPYEPDVYYSYDNDVYTLITDETYDGTYYRKVTGQYEKVTDTTNYPFKPNTYYSYDGSNYTLISGAYATTYVLYITLPKTYELTTNYRVTGATYESVVNNKSLLLKADDDIDKQTINANFFGSTDGVEIDADNETYRSRVAITIDGQPYYGYDNIAGLGLLSVGNPNKLQFELSVVPQGTSYSTIDNGTLTFRSDDDAPTNILTMTNDTINSTNQNVVEYRFLVLTSDMDYNKVKYNDNLLQIDTDNDKLVNYISVSKAELNSDNFELAYLNYLPSDIPGQVGWAITNNDGLKFKIVEYRETTDYSSKVVIDKNELSTYPSVVKVWIVTMNGVASEIELVITDTNIAYGYDGNENDYETVWAGTQIGKLTDKDANKNVRVIAIDNLNDPANPKDMLNNENGYTITYYGAMLGKISHLPLGTELNFDAENKDLISYSSNIISSRSVANTTYVTMIFDIKHDGHIINRIYYKLRLENDIKIGVNTSLDTQSAIELYLGSDIYSIGYVLIKTEEEYNSYQVEDIYYQDQSQPIGAKPDWAVNTYYVKATTIDLLESEKGELTKIETLSQFESAKEVYNASGNKIEKPNEFTAGSDIYMKYSNNLFVTLEQYSTDQTIANNSALYNGTGKSALSPSVVNNYLRFTVTNLSAELVGKVSIGTDGKLKIKGNPKGSFTLNVYSANGTGYGESFTISVNQYDITTAKFNDRINDNAGAGFASGHTTELFNTNIGLNADDKAKYAFEMYRLGYGINNNIQSQILDVNRVKVFYQVAVFDYNTTISTIKNSTVWSDPETITIMSKSVDLPSVKYSADPEIKEYQIVSYRLGITYNGETKYYYAHYKVYNAVQIMVNQFYDDVNKKKTITYTEGAWSDGSTITIMDINNTGMYASVTPVTLTSQPDSWTGYYVRKSTDIDSPDYHKFKAASGEWNNATIYYMLNDVANDNDITNNYTAWLIAVDDNGNKVEKEVTLSKSGTTITGTLPPDLFKNQQTFTFELRLKATGSVLLRDTWTFKANKTITAKHRKPLRDFFLTSEIGDQKYYNVDIIGIDIGIGTNYANFVENATLCSEGTPINLVNGYQLIPVTYTATAGDGNDVFTIEATYYVLVGHSTAMSFNLNGGTYYIVLTIDDDEIDEADNSATIKLAPFVTIWEYNTTDGFKGTSNPDITVAGADIVADGSKVILNGINTLTSNKSAVVTISYGGISRDIELYFNIKINSKLLDDENDTGYMVDSGGGELVKNARTLIKEALANKNEDPVATELTEYEIENDINLKKSLLSLITFDTHNVSTDPYSNEYNYFKVEVTKDEGNGEYVIKYMYDDGISTYTRTLKIQVPAAS